MDRALFLHLYLYELADGRYEGRLYRTDSLRGNEPIWSIEQCGDSEQLSQELLTALDGSLFTWLEVEPERQRAASRVSLT